MPSDPALRDELAERYVGLQVMRYNGMRMLTNLVKQRRRSVPRRASASCSGRRWHRSFGETAMDVIGADALTRRAARAPATYELDELHHIFMASRAETIYAGSSEIQRNIIGERVLGPPTRAPLNRSTTT